MNLNLNQDDFFFYITMTHSLSSKLIYVFIELNILFLMVYNHVNYGQIKTIKLRV